MFGHGAFAVRRRQQLPRTCYHAVSADTEYINAYSLLHSQGIYDGQRAVAAEKRVVNLTRRFVLRAGELRDDLLDGHTPGAGQTVKYDGRRLTVRMGV